MTFTLHETRASARRNVSSGCALWKGDAFKPVQIHLPAANVRFLRLIGSPACRGDKRVPLAPRQSDWLVAPDALHGTGRRPGDGRGADAADPPIRGRQASVPALGSSPPRSEPLGD